MPCQTVKEHKNTANKKEERSFESEITEKEQVVCEQVRMGGNAKHAQEIRMGFFKKQE